MAAQCPNLQFYLHNATDRVMIAGVQSQATPSNTKWELATLLPGEIRFQRTFQPPVADHVLVFVMD